MSNKVIGIIGNGVVGSAVANGFIDSQGDVLLYDKLEKRRNCSLDKLLQKANMIFVCVPTPMKDDGTPDLSGVLGTFEEIKAKDNLTNTFFAIKSTVPPATTEKVNQLLGENRVIFNPEFLTERRAKFDFVNASRVVLGGEGRPLNEFANLYSECFPSKNIIKMDARSAEFLKYATNCFFAAKVSFANEMKQAALRLGVEWDKVVQGLKTKHDICPTHLEVPGPDGKHGFGGKCFPKDINAFIHLLKENDVDPEVLEAVWEKNLEVREDPEWK